MITKQQFLDQTDIIGAMVEELWDALGNSSDPAGAYLRAQALRVEIVAMDDDAYEMDLQGGVLGSGGMRLAVGRTLAQVDANGSLRMLLGGLIATLEAYFAKYGVAGASRSIQEFVDDQNGGETPDFSCLVAPQFARLYYLCRGGDLGSFQAGLWLTPTGVFSPLVEDMGQYNIATTTFTAGDAIDVDRYAEVEPEGVVLGDVDGTAAVTVTGVNHAGTEARTWTGTADNLMSGETFTLTPTEPGDRLREVTDIGVTGAATEGIVGVRSLLERDIMA